MHKIYFENRCIIICKPEDNTLSDPNAIEFHLGEDPDIVSFINMFEISNSLTKVYIPSDDVEKTYKLVCSQFKEVNAGGGLVSNKRGDFLLISRYNLWDLPKGHQEKDEKIEVTSLREVQEETGIDELEIRKFICKTDHCYKRDGIWHLKHTYWYDMLYTNPLDLTPQREEDITLATWVAKCKLPLFLKKTYPSIIEVFREMKI